MGAVLAAGKYVTWGVVSISLTNLLVVVVMLVAFVAALLLPFPHAHEATPPPHRADEDDAS